MSHPPARWRIGVSRCLLGEPVRYDGGHKRNGYVVETLQRHFDLVAFCPELEVGLGVPRPPIRLVRHAQSVRALGVEQPELDVTLPLTRYLDQVRERVAPLVGFILKQGSPSCGLEVALHEAERPIGTTAGLFSGRLRAALPWLPVEEEGRLSDPRLRENFLTRLFVHGRWRDLPDGGLDFATLLAFHRSHKMLLLAHDEACYRRLGRWLAIARQLEPGQRAEQYLGQLLQGLERLPTPGSHGNALQHLAGFLKRQLDARQRGELAATIDAYRQGALPWTTPVALLNHHFQHHPHPFALAQHYLRPLPAELLGP
ncbi:MAG TPA: DUF523 and DUF1722 domain-containing protein [Pseudomonadales bacterium]|nr:DUF523 and DUF1722 domain-containing protein [Pseudomonadales bacterium]